VLEDGGDDVHIAMRAAPEVEEVAATEPGGRELEAVTGCSTDECSASADASARTMARVTRCVDRPTQVLPYMEGATLDPAGRGHERDDGWKRGWGAHGEWRRGRGV